MAMIIRSNNTFTSSLVSRPKQVHSYTSILIILLLLCYSINDFVINTSKKQLKNTVCNLLSYYVILFLFHIHYSTFLLLNRYFCLILIVNDVRTLVTSYYVIITYNYFAHMQYVRVPVRASSFEYHDVTLVHILCIARLQQ